MSVQLDNFSGEATSTGVQTVTVATYGLSENKHISVSGAVQISNDDGSQIGVVNVDATLYRGTGNAALRGVNVSAGVLPLALIATVVTVDVSGSDVRVRATGIALNDIHFLADMRIRQLEPA